MAAGWRPLIRRWRGTFSPRAGRRTWVSRRINCESAMPLETWFIFDLGNTVIKLAYERVLENICRNASMKRDALVDLLEKPGGYRDLESGAKIGRASCRERV